MRKNTNEDVDNRLIGRNIKRLDEYINKEIKINFQCLKCNHIWEAKPGNILNNKRGCPKCARLLRLSNEIVDSKLIDRNIIRLDKIINNKVKINFKCFLCNYIWKTSPDSILNGNKTGCPNCYGHLPLNNEIADERLINRSILRIGDYINNFTKIQFKCLKKDCNYIWDTSPQHIFNGTGCPKCSFGKNETIVFNTLLNNNIDNERHKSIKKIIENENRRLIVDFYISTQNTIIEYNGAQHYGPVCFAGMNLIEAEIKFERQKERDKYLENFCLSNNIKLIWIDGRKYTNLKLSNYIENYIIPILEAK